MVREIWMEMENKSWGTDDLKENQNAAYGIHLLFRIIISIHITAHRCRFPSVQGALSVICRIFAQYETPYTFYLFR